MVSTDDPEDNPNKQVRNSRLDNITGVDPNFDRPRLVTQKSDASNATNNSRLHGSVNKSNTPQSNASLLYSNSTASFNSENDNSNQNQNNKKSSQNSFRSSDFLNNSTTFRTGSTTSLYNITTNDSCALQILIYGDYNRLNRKTILGCVKIDLKQVRFAANANCVKSRYSIFAANA